MKVPWGPRAFKATKARKVLRVQGALPALKARRVQWDLRASRVSGASVSTTSRLESPVT